MNASISSSMTLRLSRQYQLEQFQHLHAAGCAAWQSLLQGLNGGTGQQSYLAPGGCCVSAANSYSNSSSCQADVQQYGHHTQLPQQQQNCKQHKLQLPLLQQTNTQQDRPQRDLSSRVMQDQVAPATMSCNPATLQEYARLPADNACQLQQWRHYHPAQHRARALTVKLQQKQQWQDLQLLFDSSGSGKALNAIHLSTMLLQLSRVAPRPQLVPAHERQQLKQFTQELVSACHQKLHRMDHKGLASFTQSLIALGYDVHHQRSIAAVAGAGPDHQQSSAADSSSNSSSLLDDILWAGIRQLPQASVQSCSILCSSLAMLLQQQQQDSQSMQQQQLLQGLVQALTTRIHSLAAAGQVTAVEACRLSLAAGRLAAAVRAAAGSSTEAVGLSAELKSLVVLVAQQVAAAVAAAADGADIFSERVTAPEDVGVLLYSLARARAWPGWEAVLQLLQQYSRGIDSLMQQSTGSLSRGPVLHASSSSSSGSSSRRSHAGGIEQQQLPPAEVLIRSLPSTMWAIGRLVQQQQQQQQRLNGKHWWKQRLQLQQQPQQYLDVWTALNRCLLAADYVIGELSPVQLSQLSAGLCKVVDATGSVIGDAAPLLTGGDNQFRQQNKRQKQQQQQAEGNSGTAGSQQPSAAAAQHQETFTTTALQQACDHLQRQLESPALKGLMQQHVARVEALLPLIPLDVRLQLADSYRPFSRLVELPRSVRVVFDRDAAADC